MGITGTHHIFGIDGGGTGCRVAVCDQNGKRLAEASGGPANFSTDRTGTIANIRNALSEVTSKLGISASDLGASIVRIGLAGILTDADVATMFDALPFAKSIVSDDRETSLAGALGSSDGVLAAIGTGTFIAARSQGTVRYFGGWGLHLSDQASGAWLGRKALRLTVLAEDGLRPHSDLTQALLARTNDLPGMVAFAREASPADFGALARDVIDAATSGDKNARQLMQKGADYLEACLDATTLSEGDVICLSGGVGPHYAPYLKAAHQERVRPARGTALDGALLLAQKEFEQMETPQ